MDQKTKGNMSEKWSKGSVKLIIGQCIQKKRQQLGASLEQIARQSDLHATYIGSLEKGRHNISLKSLFMLAKALKCHVKDFITNENPAPRHSTSPEKFTEICQEDLSSILVEFGKLIKERRKLIDISQSTLAVNCCLHLTYIGSVERGERNISIENIFSLARALDCNPRDLIPNIKIKLEEDPVEERKDSIRISETERKNLLQQFGMQVKQKRMRLGITQNELASRSGMHKTYISTLERGLENISLEKIFMLARALQWKIPELTGDDCS
jgi:transcriptional regulator with XRE-family HTH domain